MEQDNQVQMEQENQTQGAQITPASNDKKKRMFIIVAACVAAVIVLAIVAAAMMGGQSGAGDEGKDPYELFEWGAKRETVCKKLDEINEYYDSSDDRLEIPMSDVQGSGASGRFTLLFGESGMLKKIFGTISFGEYSSDDPFNQMSTIVDSFNRKYKSIPDDDNIVWESKTWRITLKEPKLHRSYSTWVRDTVKSELVFEKK